MLLCDIGNTSYHFLDENHSFKESVQTFNPKEFPQNVFYICVNIEVAKLLEPLENWIDIGSFLQKDIYYETMGIDRKFACEAVDDGVIVDAGSAITVDVVNNAQFQGGFIFPGFDAMQQAFSTISSALEVKINFDIDLNNLPKNTPDAITYGVLKPLITQVESFKKQVYLTGGNAKRFAPFFENSIVNEHLIFDGMKKVLKNRSQK